VKNVDTLEMAINIYNSCCDMDFLDYENEKETEIAEIENALYYLKTISQNEHNKGFKTLLKALEMIFQEK